MPSIYICASRSLSCRRGKRYRGGAICHADPGALNSALGLDFFIYLFLFRLLLPPLSEDALHRGPGPFPRVRP